MPLDAGSAKPQPQPPAPFNVGNNTINMSHPSDDEEKHVHSPSSDLSLERETPGKPQSSARDGMSKLKWFVVCVGLYITAFLYGLDTTIAAAIQGPIFVSLGEIEKLPWIGVGFPMGSVATLLLFGRCYGLFQIKWLYISAFVVFEVGSAICGASPTMDAMIVGRVITGIGGGAMYIGTLNYVTAFTNLHERGLYVALIGGFWGLGCVLGPVVGGAFAASSASWRWAFYINLVLAVIEAPIFLIRFPGFNPVPDMTTRDKFKTLDWAGFLLHAGSFTLFMVSLSQAGTAWSWSSGGAIALWVVTGVVIIMYALQQYFCIFTRKDYRLFPVQFVTSRTQVLLYFGTAGTISAFFVTTYYIPLYFQFTRGDSAIDAAVRLLPFIFVNVAFNVAAGALLPHGKYYAPWYLGSGILIVIGGALMFTVTENTTTSAIYGYEVLIAAGAGATLQIGYAVAAAKAEPSEADLSIRFQNVSQIGSTAIALAIGGCIFQNLGFERLQQGLDGQGYSQSDLRTALAGTLSPVLSSGSPEVHDRAVQAIVQTISDLYALVIAAGALMIASSLAMRWERLNLGAAVAGG